MTSTTTPRKAMSPQRRLRIFERDHGVCWHCGVKIDGVHEAWTIEHIRALGLSGEDEDKNCAPAHEHCRRVKDKDDIARIAKAKRVKARHIGIRKPPTLQGPGFPKRREARPKPPLQPKTLFWAVGQNFEGD